MENIVIKKEKMPLKRKLFILSIVFIPLCSFAFFYVYINFNSFLLAFQKIDINENYSFVGLDNFKKFFETILTGADAGLAFVNSLKNFWTTFLISTPLYILFAYYISKKMPGEKLLFTVVMLPSAVSTFVYALCYKKFVEVSLQDIMRSMGIFNFPQLISHPDYCNFNNLFFSIWISFGSNVLIFSNAMTSIDKEIMEGAMIDGANDRVQFFGIVLPLVWPTFTTYCVTGLTGMFTWSGALMTFYMYDAPSHIWGLDYYFTVTIKNTGSLGYMNYPMVATAGLFVTIISTPVVFFAKWFMNKLDKTVD